jgi:hypothetical protein
MFSLVFTNSNENLIEPIIAHLSLTKGKQVIKNHKS